MKTETAESKLGSVIDALYRLSLRIETEEAKVKRLRDEYQVLEQSVIQSLEEAKLAGATGRRAKVTIHPKEHPQIADMTLFWNFVRGHNAFELFQRRINVTAWRERCESLGRRVPGTSVFVDKRLTLNKL